ncbi:serine hydrolase [Peterkaempfera bronchialis]|uniref:serine hydrolase n=1 Tax=Peterkaempfera bronchialis TaxID=2126346 RepID=UPI003C2D3347
MGDTAALRSTASPSVTAAATGPVGRSAVPEERPEEQVSGSASPSDTGQAVAADVAAAVARAVRPVTATAEGNLSVAVADLTTGLTAGYGGSGHTFATASIAKVDILAALLLQAQNADRRLTAQERAWAATMIENSDNDAADALYTRIGLAAGLDRANRTFGLTATTAGAAGRWGLTETTAADQLTLLQAVFGQDSPLGSASRDYLHTLMGQVEADQGWGVSAAADPGTAPLLKNGWLPRSSTGLWVVNSIGRVDHGGHRLLIAVLSDGSTTQAKGVSLVESAAEAAADALTDALETRT